MSWTSDASTPGADPTDESAALDAAPGAPETEAPVIETEAAPPPKAKAPRSRRHSPRTPAAPVETVPIETEAPVVETEAAPARRRGRRQANAPEEAAIVPPVAAEAPYSPAEETPETPAPRGRSRGRRRAAGAEETPAAPQASAEAQAPPPTRRRGRRTATQEPEADVAGLAEGVPVEEEAPVPEADASAPEAPTSSRRRRGRRRDSLPDAATPTETPLTLDAPPELIAPSVESEPAGEGAAIEDSETRSRRRGRRSRRRRGQDDVIIESVELTEIGTPLPDDSEDEEAEEDTFFQPPPPAPVYVAPPLVPPVQSLPDGAHLPRVAASIRQDIKGLAQVLINGQAHLPHFFFVNAEAAERGEVVDSQIRQAADAGIHLFSGVMYLPLRNAYGDRSYGAADAFVQQVLAADPDGYLLPRLQFVPTNYWVRTHPDQLAHYADGSEGDVTLASADFWADCVDALEALVAHFADPNTPGGDRVIGFHLDRGEWFYDAQCGPDISAPNREAFQHWLQAKYQAPYALRAAWYAGSVTFEDAEIPLPPAREGKKGGVPLYAGAREGRWVDYALFSSEIVARIITGLASAVKALSGEKLLVAVSYGYTLEFCTRNDSGHLALAHVLASPDVDIVAGPNSYAARGAGGTGAFGALVDSVALHGKLWLVEDDTKTFLAETETPDSYNLKVALGADTQAAHQRHFGAALAHKAGVTWMDLWGQGWLDDSEIWRELGGLQEQARLWGKIAPGVKAPDVAVLVDEASLAYFKNDPQGLGQNLIAKTRDLLLRAGASVGFYLQSDVTQGNFPEAKLYLFLNALRVTTQERQAIREKLQRPGRTLAWLYAPALYDEKGAASPESSELVGMTLRLQPWNARLGSQTNDVRHPITERLRGGKRLGQDEILNPSFAISDPQATVLAEYASNGAPSLAVREHPGGWKSVFIGDPHLTVELLRGLYAYAGVPVYDAQDDIVYVGDGVLLIHAPFTGQRTVSLPQRATVYDVMENKIIAVDTRSFRVFLRTRTTRLFLWGDRDAVQAATGLELPAAPLPSATPEAPILPPPPDVPTAASLPLSEPAFELAARYEREHRDQQENATGPQVSDLTAVLEMDEGDLATDEADAVEGETDGTAEGDAPRPRSRWQRRRAAARARRDAERQASGGLAEADNTANPPIDIAAILPGLPPRRPFEPEPTAEPESRAEEDRELPS